MSKHLAETSPQKRPPANGLTQDLVEAHAALFVIDQTTAQITAAVAIASTRAHRVFTALEKNV